MRVNLSYMYRSASNIKALLILLAFISSIDAVFAQGDADTRLLHTFSRDADNTTHSDFFIVKFKNPISKNIRIVRKLDAYTAIIAAAQTDLIPQEEIVIKSPANTKWKLSSLQLIKRIKNDQQKIIISGNGIDQLALLIKSKYDHLRILHIDSASSSMLLKAGRKDVDAFLNEPLITFIDLQSKPSTEISIIGYDPGFHGINAVTNLIPGANGRNIVVGVKEQRMQPDDLDLYKRILPSPIEATEISNHATVISSIIGGAGNSFYDGLGIANDCQFFSSSFADLFPDNANVLKNAKVSVQNHSYGTIIQQFYGAEAASYDAQVSTHDVLHVFSAGNQGSLAASEGPYANIIGYANLTGNFKSAKNIITVGAIDNKGNIPVESSAGPLYDGRLAPQLIALGPNGTSDAAAMVTGTAAVLQQIFSDSNHQQIPPSTLIRSALYTSADDVYKPGIDYKTGYGLLNSYKAVKLLQRKNYFLSVLSKGEEWSGNISIPLDASQIKITLSWNDLPAALNNDKALINDLDLELTGLSTGITYRPWILNTYPHKDSLAKLPFRDRDSLNTSEQISIRLPAAGNYRLSVKMHEGISSSVPFAITYWVDTLHTFRFISPVHTGDINREENGELNIRWTTETKDSTETGDLYISYDRGARWNKIAAGLRLTDGLYHWTIADFGSTGLLKMVTGSGEFHSNEFIIADLTRPLPDFVCADSFRLSWNKHIYATGYDLYSLTDSSHLKKLMSTVDTFIVLDRKKHPSLVYAVQPVLVNHLPAARSIAFNIELQGVQCFFKTLNYTLESGNQLKMILEISAAIYADSVYFEEVTRDGSLVKLFEAQKAADSQPVYTSFATQIAGGNIYIRARIRLKNGAIVYTDIIPVFSSGSKNVMFYPNPVRRSERLMYTLKQGISPDCRLQIYDAHGLRLKDLGALPGTIDVSLIVRGIYFFRLIDHTGKTIATEKIIIQ